VIAAEVGASLPSITIRLEPAMLVAYAGATWDWHRLHHDSEYAADLGLDGPVVDGQMFGALLAERCMKAFGPGAWVRKLSFRLRSVVYAGDSITIEGRVTEVRQESGRLVVSVEQEVKVGDRTAVGPASAEVVLHG
jgi:acyl dehydratase